MTEQRPPNKRQQQAAATRERMLQAARQVFEERGYRAASVGAITAAADTAHGTFYLYFRNKDDAFAQVMAEVQDEFRDAQRTALASVPADGVAANLRAFLGVFLAHAGLWRALLEGMLQSPAIEAMWLSTRASLVDDVARWLAAEQARGAARSFDPEQAALALASMAEWHAFTSLVLQAGAADGPSAEQVDRAVDTLADLWQHAVFAPRDGR